VGHTRAAGADGFVTVINNLTDAVVGQSVAMDGFGGYKTAAVEALPDAMTVMDPFHVVALCGQKLDLCRQRVQQDTLGHRGRSGDPLSGPMIMTRSSFLQRARGSRRELVVAHR
jgi:transposase